MLIIPAIDLIDGRTVRLTQGDYERRSEYGIDPAEVACRFQAEGAEWLHVVDLDGAKAGRPVNLATLLRISEACTLEIEFGGGLRDFDAIDAVLEAGATRVVLGSRLAQDPEFSLTAFSRYGEAVVAGIDTRAGRVAVQGWLEDGRADGVELAQAFVAMGCRRVIWTDIARDGSLTGPNLEGLRTMLAAVDVPVVASGGVGDLDDLRALAELANPSVEAVIVGKALYEGRFTLAEALAATRTGVF